jgi:hypothetical protein
LYRDGLGQTEPDLDCPSPEPRIAADLFLRLQDRSRHRSTFNPEFISHKICPAGPIAHSIAYYACVPAITQKSGAKN